jgi:RNA polymerase sigma factor (sigma-70 family)
MANRVSAAAKEGIYALFQWGAMGNWSDSQLIAQFVTSQDGSETAFRVLIHRHGPMVLGICRRVLGDEHAAEDAFQATFLVLVKKAGALRDCNLLTNWLYGVALRVANKERAKGARRRFVERQAADRVTQGDKDAGLVELRSVIDEEIHRLPERYRVPLVLCHMEGLRHDEVARQLGCPVGTVESRLARAREQLRVRLERRGLAPTASVLGTLLRPPGASMVASPLVEATLRAAVELSASRALVGTGALAGWCWLKSTVGFIPTFHASTVASTLFVAAGAAVMSLAVYRADGQPASFDAAVTPPPSIKSDLPEPAPEKSLKRPPRSVERTASTPGPTPENARNQDKTIRATRFPSALAKPLTDITIDGRLDDWPKNLKKYAIANQLYDHPNYNSKPVDASNNPNAYFMAGYDLKTAQIYLAVVVHDKDVVVHQSDILKTDAVEIYIDGTLSERAMLEIPSGDWRDTFDAATMPVLQYVGVPGQVPAYADWWNGNPSLVYARTKQTTTKMKFQHEHDVITYEWSIKPFDHFPDRPTRLFSGKRLGLDVAVVDKSKNTTKNSRPPTFLTWGLPPEVFKGSDASSLGELILAGSQGP